ncbi:MAG: DNA-binding protein [Oscillospiraceae bacterium]|nr:DNA-binding protein [Oscillospiraceae bacterium]
MKRITVGFDTSNYTTSCAWFDGETGENSGRLLDVKPGELGLRQSEALFSHVKRLPEIVGGLTEEGEILAVGASATPRETEGSYMPCFLAGVCCAEVMAHFLKAPYFAFSHQQGHIAAAAWSAGHMELLDTPHLAWHLSGGTTELLYVKPEGVAVRCEIVGKTQDVSAGQIVDRAGQLLGLQFPSGKALDALAAQVKNPKVWSPKVNGLTFSLSGVEHKVGQMVEKGECPENVAYFALASVFSAVKKATENAKKEFGDIPVLYSGGVASNSLLRKLTPGGIFAQPKYSTDNSMGCAILTWRAVNALGR